jgi:hypothetical protein
MKTSKYIRSTCFSQALTIAALLGSQSTYAMGPWWGPGYPMVGFPAYYGYYGGFYGAPMGGWLPSPSFNYSTTIINAPSTGLRGGYTGEEPRTLTCQRRATPSTYECNYP